MHFHVKNLPKNVSLTLVRKGQ